MGLSQADDVSSPDASPNPDQPCSPALGRRSRASSASDVCSHGSSRRIPSGSQNLAGIKQPTSPPGPSRLATGKEEPVDAGTCTSPPFSSPSIPSSIAYSNPGLSTSLLRRELSRTTPPRNADAVTSRAVRYDLARRLSQLARRLTYDGSDSNMDEIVLGNQLEELEKAVGRGGSGPEEAQKLPGEAAMLDGAARRSNGSSAIASSASSMLRSRFSDLSASLHREREAAALADAPRGIEEELSPKKGMSARQAKKVIAEMSKLNDELTSVVSNLKARQEESEVSQTATACGLTHSRCSQKNHFEKRNRHLC